MLAASVLEIFAGLSSMQALLLATGLAGLVVLIASTNRRIRKSRRRSEEPVGNRQELKQRETASVRDVEQVMIELDELSREIHGRLDTKIAKLERLIRDADVRIARLSSEVTVTSNRRLDATLEAESPQRPWSTKADSPSEGNDPPVSHALSQHAALYGMADDGMSTAEISKKTGRLAGEIELVLSLRKVAAA